MESANRFPFDGAAAVDLTPTSAGPYTAGTINGKPFDLKNQIVSDAAPHWANNDRGYTYLALVINVTACTVAADETYVFSVQTDSVESFDVSPISHMTFADLGILNNATGPFVFIFDVATLLRLDPNAKFLRLVCSATNESGTASINYNAWVGPLM